MAGAGAVQIQVIVNAGQLQSIMRRIGMTQKNIFTGLNARAAKMGAEGLAMARELAPEGSMAGWAPGNPTLKNSHRIASMNAFRVEIVADAPHAAAIHNGFAPHMPPPEAWIGQQELSFIMRKRVLLNGTPVAPRPWFDQVEAYLEVENVRWEQKLAASAFGSGLI